MRAIIIAAGDGTRWGNYTGVPKHLVSINGEVLLERTVRQLRDRGVSDIFVVGPDDKRYNIPGAAHYIPEIDYEAHADADKFLSSRELWDTSKRTVIFYGDVYFSDAAMDRIVSYKERDWKLFCRPGASKITGTKWGECFAISLYPEHHEVTLHQLYRIARLALQDVISRCGGWELVRAMMGRPDNKIRHPHVLESPLYYVIDDETDDIDYPEDYERLKKAIQVKKNGQATTMQ